MSAMRKILLGVGAAVVATGLASTANAHVVAAGPGACDAYARQYAAVNAPRFGLFGWNAAYRQAYNDCIIGGPTFVSASPFAPVTVGTALAAPVHAGAYIAGSALHAGATIAGAALSIPATILGGTAAALAPAPVVTTAPAAPVVTAEPAAAPEPVVVRNFRGTYEAEALAEAETDVEEEPEADVEARAVAEVEAPEMTTTAALAVPADGAAPAQFTPEWYAYCEAKYRSFNPETGMYLAFSGTFRMCD